MTGPAVHGTPKASNTRARREKGIDLSQSSSTMDSGVVATPSTPPTSSSSSSVSDSPVTAKRRLAYPMSKSLQAACFENGITQEQFIRNR